jgi:hypothetical protein
MLLPLFFLSLISYCNAYNNALQVTMQSFDPATGVLLSPDFLAYDDGNANTQSLFIRLDTKPENGVAVKVELSNKAFLFCNGLNKKTLTFADNTPQEVGLYTFNKSRLSSRLFRYLEGSTRSRE